MLAIHLKLSVIVWVRHVPRAMWLAALATIVLAAGGPAAAQQATDPADHVIVISIDGLLPEYAARPQDFGLSLPALEDLALQGSVAERVEAVYPSSTYPSHTSIATGVRPARHGVVANTRFAPGKSDGGGWYFETEAIHVPTLWERAQQAGLKTGGVSWPVTVGSSIDILYPEGHQAPQGTTWLDLARTQSTPGLIDAVVEELGGFGANDNRDPIQRDRFATAVALHIIRNHRPNLLLIHLVETDYRQHASGPHSPEARAAFARVDAHVGAIAHATEEAGIRDRTTFIITGDHGFAPVHSVLQPNVALHRAGLLETDADGDVLDWQAIADGPVIRLRRPDDPVLAQRVAELFHTLASVEQRGLFRVIPRDELTRLGADPEALLAIEPAVGYYWSGGFEGERFVAPTDRRGAHGYLPTNPLMHTGLILSGAGVVPGVSIPFARQVDIAPTVAHLLGFEMPDTDGSTIARVLQQEPGIP